MNGENGEKSVGQNNPIDLDGNHFQFPLKPKERATFVNCSLLLTTRVDVGLSGTFK